MNAKIAIAGGVVLLILAGAFLFMSSKEERKVPVAQTEVPEGATVVTLGKDGFSPAELTIAKGETVTFRTTNGELFWPASNLHPSHTIYPEFDPLTPVQPNTVWSFTFEKPGEWKFHDHLAPYFTGVITVTE